MCCLPSFKHDFLLMHKSHLDIFCGYGPLRDTFHISAWVDSPSNPSQPLFLLSQVDLYLTTYQGQVTTLGQQPPITMTYPWAHKNHVKKWQVVPINYIALIYSLIQTTITCEQGIFRFPICHKCMCYLVTLLHDYDLPFQSCVDYRLCKLDIHHFAGEMTSHNF